METKIKVKYKTPAVFNNLIRYQASKNAWGLEAIYDACKLEFSKPLATKKLLLSKIKQLVYKKPADQSIITTVDIYNLLSKSAKIAWENAYKICKARKGTELSVEDIFLSLLKTTSVKMVLKRLKVNTAETEKLIKNYLLLGAPLYGNVVQKIPFEAFILSTKIHNHKVGSLMLLGALLKAVPHENILQAIFSNIGLTTAKLELFAVWYLKLNYDFPKNSTSEKLLYCLTQAELLEEHFGYYYNFDAIEKAMLISQKQTLKNLEHKKTVQLLIKASILAKNKNQKIITAEYIK
jgi:hypothetical protein